MFNSTVLDVAVGLIFTFLALSLTVSAIVEAFASVLKWRSSTLLSGIKELLNDPNLTGLALNIYNHGLVSPLDAGGATTARGLPRLPAYIEPRQFADALLDVTKITKDAPANIEAAIDTNVTDPQLNRLMKGMADRATGDVRKMRDEIASWFDNGMDRVSGIYKRKTQLWSFVIALLTAGILNVSSIEVGKALWDQPMLARTIAPMPGQTATDVLAQLQKLPLPIGWSYAKLANLWSWSGAEMLVGWLITAFATLFGAPFWFDTLQQIVRLKGSGPSPAEKASGTGAAE